MIEQDARLSNVGTGPCVPVRARPVFWAALLGAHRGTPLHGRRRALIAAWLHDNRALRLNPKHLVVEPTRAPAVFLGYRISRAGIAPSRKLRRRFRQRLRSAAAQGEDTLVRSIRSYQGLLLFPH